MDKLQVIKIGGNVIDDPVQLKSFLEVFASLKTPAILVHGGGKKATEISRKLGIEPQMVDGRRITTSRDLEVAVMVYAGSLNKSIVSGMQALGRNAIGLSGADGNCIRAVKRPVAQTDYGFVGDITKVNGSLLQTLLNARIVPVICAITHDGNGQLLNTNADTIAGSVASAMAGLYDTELIYCFEQHGVLKEKNDPASVLSRINKALYADLKTEGYITAGMLPKLDNCFAALEQNVKQVLICSPQSMFDPSLPSTRVTLT